MSQITDPPVTDNARLCEECGDPFASRRKDARFCSATCRKKASRAKPDELAGLKAELAELERAQVAHRGEVKNHANKVIRGPYVATRESEERAGKIINLRRRIARAEHPV